MGSPIKKSLMLPDLGINDIIFRAKQEARLNVQKIVGHSELSTHDDSTRKFNL